MISEGIGRENIQTFDPIGYNQMSKGEPIKLLTTHFVFGAQSFISSRNWLRLLIPWDGKSMEVKFELEKPSVFGKRVSDLWGN